MCTHHRPSRPGGWGGTGMTLKSVIRATQKEKEMFRTLTNCAIVTLALILVMASTASAVQLTQTLFEEDFEGGDGLVAADYGWTSQGGIDLPVPLSQ